MSQKVYWLQEYCKYIISMKYGDSMMLISNFGKNSFKKYENNLFLEWCF